MQQSELDRMNDISAALKSLRLPDDAYNWLINLWYVVQAFDDWQDNERREDIKDVLVAALFNMPSNPWFMQHAGMLLPISLNCIYKWIASNEYEKDRTNLHKAYMLRAGYWDMVLQCCIICGVAERPSAIYDLYGESFEEFLKDI